MLSWPPKDSPFWPLMQGVLSASVVAFLAVKHFDADEIMKLTALTSGGVAIEFARRVLGKQGGQ